MRLSMRALTKPSRRSRSSSGRRDDVLFRQMGANMMMREPLGRASMLSTISWTVWAWIGVPHDGQCGLPARAKSRRR